MSCWRSLASTFRCRKCNTEVFISHQLQAKFSSWLRSRNGQATRNWQLFSRLKSRTALPKKKNVALPPKGSRGVSKSNPWKLLMVIIPATTFCLGTWQVFRLQWKVNLIEEMERKTRLPPITLPTDILDQVEATEYSRVSLTGYFNHSKELHMWPRTLNTPTDAFGRKNTEPGAYVVTPFFCHELGGWVLVNRGWVPERRRDPKTRKSGQIKGDVSLTAVVRAPEKRAAFAPENDPSLNHWSYKDVAAMAEQADTLPLYLDADATTTVRGGPIGGQTRISLRNDHLQYVFTWYTLALATSYLFFKLWTKGRA